MLLHPAGLAAGAGVAVFYTLFSAALQAAFYWRRGGDPASWKTQPSKGVERLGRRAGVPWVPALDAVLHRDDSSRVKRAPYHWLLATVNTAMAAVAAGLSVHLIATGRSRVYLEWPAEWSAAYCAVRLVVETVAIVSLHQVEEYYWHRLMHTPALYARAHKLHHAYKAPEPFDDMYIHPAEAAGYYIILYSPPFTVATHWGAFAAYMAVMGVAGVMDHSGIRWAVPWLYDTADHDAHHALFDVNYAFPFPFMDMLHGTYRGTWGGWAWREAKRQGVVVAHAAVDSGAALAAVSSASEGSGGSSVTATAGSVSVGTRSARKRR